MECKQNIVVVYSLTEWGVAGTVREQYSYFGESDGGEVAAKQARLQPWGGPPSSIELVLKVECGAEAAKQFAGGELSAMVWRW